VDLRKHINGNFDASQLLKCLDRVKKPFFADHWQFSLPAAMFGAAILIAVVSFAVWKKCCAQASNTAQTPMIAAQLPPLQPQPQIQHQPQPQLQMQPPPSSSSVRPSVRTAKTYFQFFKTNSPSAHLHLNKGRASKVLHSSSQNSWFYMYIPTLYFFYFVCVWFYFSTLVLLFACTFYISQTYILSLFLALLLQKQTPPKKGRDIIPDIFIL